jgi:cobaltochelatase CobT
MILDGTPADDATLLLNPGNYLGRNWHGVIDLIETRLPVKVIPISIGQDVTRYNRRAVTIVGAEELAGARTEQLAALFGKERTRDASSSLRRREG